MIEIPRSLSRFLCIGAKLFSRKSTIGPSVFGDLSLPSILQSCETGMSVYMIVEITVKNSELYSRYVAQVPQVVDKYGGRYLIRGGRATPLSGNWNPERILLLEFETVEQLRKCFESREYLEIAPLREQSTTSKSIVVEGCAPPKRAAE